MLSSYSDTFICDSSACMKSNPVGKVTRGT